MSRENHERLWQALGVVLAFTVGLCGWYMNRLVEEVDKANDGIMSVSVQVARLETQVNGIEKRLDQRIAVEPFAFHDFVAVNSRPSQSAGHPTDESR
jgi:hypothetical protein